MKFAIASLIVGLGMFGTVWMTRDTFLQTAFGTLRQADQEAMCLAAINGAPPIPSPLIQHAARPSGDLEKVLIKRPDGSADPAMFRAAADAGEPAPLLVSLHTWSGDYSEADTMATLAAQRGIHYIHPDFRGAMTTSQSCCSDAMVADIDAAIDYASENAKVDAGRIYIYGVSGGAYAALCTLSKSRHGFAGVSAWAPITDLEAWYYQSAARRHVNPRRYDYDILACTGSKGRLDKTEARARSPMYLPYDAEKTKNTKVEIFAGIMDGLSGSVPVTHAARFYNRAASESDRIGDGDLLNLLDLRAEPTSHKIGGRPIYADRRSGNTSIVIFEGGHEGLPKEALDRMMEE